MVYPDSLLPLSLKNIPEILVESTLEVNNVGMSKEISLGIESNINFASETIQHIVVDLPLNSKPWKWLVRTKKVGIAYVQEKSYGKREMTEYEENQLDLPSKHLQVLKDDEVVPLKLVEAIEQPY